MCFRCSYFAAQDDFTQVLSLLLAHGADAGKACDDSETPVFVAAEEGKYDSLRLLLAHKASPEARRQNDGFTPLMAAATTRPQLLPGHADCLRLLLSAKADHTLRSNRSSGHGGSSHSVGEGGGDGNGGSGGGDGGLTALQLAEEQVHAEAAAILREHAASIAAAAAAAARAGADDDSSGGGDDGGDVGGVGGTARAATVPLPRRVLTTAPASATRTTAPLRTVSL